MRYFDTNGKLCSNAEFAIAGINQRLHDDDVRSAIPFPESKKVNYTLIGHKNRQEKDIFISDKQLKTHRKRVETILSKACDRIRLNEEQVKVFVPVMVRVYAFSDGSQIWVETTYRSKIKSIIGREDDRLEPVRIISVSNYHESIAENYGTLLRFNVFQEHGEYEGETALWWINEPAFIPYTLKGWKYNALTNNIISPTLRERQAHEESKILNQTKDEYRQAALTRCKELGMSIKI